MSVWYDRIRDLTSTTGTGTITANNTPPVNYNTFGTKLSTNDVFNYVIVHQGAPQWEVGIGTYLGSNQFSRGIVLDGSSGPGVLVSFTAGTKDCWLDFPAYNASLSEQVFRSGILQFSSSTLLTFTPFRGDRIKINGRVYPIPAAGIAGLANTSVFVNGTGGSSLAANTNYYVYVFDNSGTLTADFRTGGHATSSTTWNVGTEILSGDDTRTLIGFIRANASNQFSDAPSTRYVRSWNNDPGRFLNSFFTATRSTVSAGVWVELNTEIRINWLNWANEVFSADYNGNIFPDAIAPLDSMMVSLGLDSSTTPEDLFTERDQLFNADGGVLCTTLCHRLAPSEGNHFMTVLVQTTAGTLTVATGANAAGSRVTLKGYLAPWG